MHRKKHIFNVAPTIRDLWKIKLDMLAPYLNISERNIVIKST